MRITKLVAPALTAIALLLGASAQAEGQATLDAFTASGIFPQPLITMTVTASGPAVGQPCFFKANGMAVVGCTVLLPGQNTMLVPDLGPMITFYTASGPGIETAIAVVDPGNSGIN